MHISTDIILVLQIPLYEAIAGTNQHKVAEAILQVAKIRTISPELKHICPMIRYY